MFYFRGFAHGLLVAVIALVMCGCSNSKPPKTGEAPPAQYFKVDPVTAGNISGKILYSGKRVVRKAVDMDEDPQCRKRHKTAQLDETLIVNQNGTLANVFIYVKQGLEGKNFEPPAEPVVMDQNGCWFQPRVVGIQPAQVFKVTNSDPLTHNIHPRGKLNREWNQSQSPSDPPTLRKFARQEVMIRVKCNIHPWMRAWIGVVNNPYYAVTGTDGSFELKNLPAGRYTVEAWQEELGTKQQQVTVAVSGKATLDFRFNEQDKQGESQ